MNKASSPLWAVTSFYNPSGYQRRRRNYADFRQRLDVPLLAVDLAFDPARSTLSPADADILVQCTDGDVMWQKERLLNLAIERLPASCRYVAWIDCDVVFENRDWAKLACEMLEKTSLLQLYSEVHHAPRDADVDALPGNRQGWTQDSMMACMVGRGNPGALMRSGGGVRSPERPAMGLAWAAPRQLLARHGLYDRCIIGGGDTALASAALGCTDAAIDRHEMNTAQRDSYLRWAEQFHADVAGRIGFVPGAVHHLWHGDMADRQSRQRHQGLARHHFDPARDLQLSPQGAWRWATDKPELHAYLRDYFGSRHEDGRPEGL